jgi:hypothetical protein
MKNKNADQYTTINDQLYEIKIDLIDVQKELREDISLDHNIDRVRDLKVEINKKNGR